MTKHNDFKKESREQAENRLAQLEGNPITKQIAGNKIWNDHLRRSGVK
jgi:hypothetical protein